MSHESEQVKGGNGAGCATQADEIVTTVHEINAEIAKAMSREMIRIGQYVLDTVFKGDPRRALSTPRHNSTVVAKISRTQRAPDQAAHVHRIRRIKQP
jgi:hypothetical protein